MTRFTHIALLAALLATTAPAQAAMQTWTFSGALDSGALVGETFAGSLSYDDAGLGGIGDEWVNLGALGMTFMGQGYDLAVAATAPQAYFLDGAFLGVSYIVGATDPKFSLIAGFSDISESYFAYEPLAGSAGFGSVTYTLAPVPEPKGTAMLLAGIALLGLMARRRV